MLRELAKVLDLLSKAVDAYETGKAVLGYVLAVTVVPVAAVVMIVTTTGKWRVIGVGLLVYSLILMVPFVLLRLESPEKLAKDWRFSLGVLLMLIPFLLAGYQMAAADNFHWAGVAFAAVPCWLLGLMILTAWIGDFLRRDDVVDRNDPPRR